MKKRKNGKNHEIGDGPIEPQFIESMHIVAQALDKMFNGEQVVKRGLPRSVGFVLLVFPYDSVDGRCNYISNGARRPDIVNMMKMQIARFEGQPDIVGNA